MVGFSVEVFFSLFSTDQRRFGLSHIAYPELWVIQRPGPQPLLRNVQSLYQGNLIRLRISSFGTRQRAALAGLLCITLDTAFILPASLTKIK